MSEKSKAKREFNKDIDKIYKEYKKCNNEKDKVNNRTFKQAIDNFYSKKGEGTIYEKDFDYYLETRYETIKGSYESFFSFASSWLSTFIPTIVLCEFNQNMISWLTWYNVLWSSGVVLGLMMISMTIFFAIGSTFLLPWIVWLFPKQTYKKYNIEMKTIVANRKKQSIITNDFINIKNLIKKYAKSGFWAMATNALILIGSWLKNKY